MEMQKDRSKFSGSKVTKALVVNVNDPYKIGRVQVRIPDIHGVPPFQQSFIGDDDLPWAVPCLPFSSAEDMGSFIIPIVGSYVWVLFEDTNMQNPVYLGSAYGIGSKRDRPDGFHGEFMNSVAAHSGAKFDTDVLDWDAKLDDPFNDISEYEGLGVQAVSSIPVSQRTEVPREMFENKGHYHPDRSVIYKSQTGHILYMDDSHKEEKVVLIDRIGQMMVFNSPHFETDGMVQSRTKYKTRFEKGKLKVEKTKSGPSQQMNRREDHLASTDQQMSSAKQAYILFRSGKAPDLDTKTEFKIYRQGTYIRNYIGPSVGKDKKLHPDDTPQDRAEVDLSPQDGAITVWSSKETGKNKAPKFVNMKHRSHVTDTSSNNRAASGVRTTNYNHNVIWDVTDDYLHGNYDQSNFFLDKDMILMNVHYPFFHMDDTDIEISSAPDAFSGKPYTLWDPKWITSETTHTFFRQYVQEIMMYVYSTDAITNPSVNLTNDKAIISTNAPIVNHKKVPVTPTQVVLEKEKITIQVGLVAGGIALGDASCITLKKGEIQLSIMDEQMNTSLYKLKGADLIATLIHSTEATVTTILNTAPLFSITKINAHFADFFTMNAAGIQCNMVPVGPPIVF